MNSISAATRERPAETDRELLELAAKAAGLVTDGHGSEYYSDGPYGDVLREGMHTSEGIWNPLTNDGDALRLAVKLGMTIKISTAAPVKNVSAFVISGGGSAIERVDDDAAGATRRAIVMAAAKVGRGMA